MSKKESTISLLKNFWDHVSKRRKIQLTALILLTIIVSVAEMVSIGAILPFLGALTAPDKILEIQFFQPLFNKLNILKPSELLFPMTLIFIIAAMLSGIMRLVLVKKWYKPHRSHAYQNLARITGSHLKVASGIAIYHFVWLLPLVILTVKQPDLSIFATALAVFPAMVFAVKFGPLASSS